MNNLYLRPGTFDQYIFKSIVNHNEYEMTPDLVKDKVILDIGAHIGSFAFLCLSMGAKKVYAFEPDPDNFFALKQNMSKNFDEDRFELHNEAVWRSDDDAEDIPYSGYFDNTGGGNVLFGKSNLYDRTDSYLVPTVPFDKVLSEIEEKIDLLKLDCEFSEFPILLTSKKFNDITHVIGEFHEIGGEYNPELTIPEHAKVGNYEKYTINDLEGYFENLGYEFQHKRTMKHLGIFKATKI